MANAANLTVNDGLATPVARTFTCVKAAPDLTIWKDKRLSKLSYWPEMTLSADVPAATAKVRKVDFRVSKPVVDVISGHVTDTGRLRLIGDLPSSMTQPEVDDLFAFFVNGLQAALVKGAVKDMDVIIG